MLLWGVTADNRDEGDEAVYSRVCRQPISRDELSLKRLVITMRNPRACAKVLYLWE